jgi:hypothetical protein
MEVRFSLSCLVFSLTVSSAPHGLRAQSDACAQDPEGVPLACEGEQLATYEFRWRIPEGEVTAYRAYVGTASLSYAEPVELDFVTVGEDGVATAAIADFDTSGDSYVALTALGPAGESLLSNELYVPATRCSSGCDADVCRELRCADGQCRFAPVPDGTQCDDGDVQTSADACSAGVCRAGAGCPAGPPRAVRLGWARGDGARSMELQWEGPLRQPGRLRVRALGTANWLEHRADPQPLRGCGARYRVPLSELEPLSRYEYAIEEDAEGGALWGETQVFSTAPPAGEAFGERFRLAFVAGLGVPGAPRSPETDRVVETLAALEPDAVLGGGGYAYSSEAAALTSGPREALERWFEALSPLLARAPLLPVYGASELAGGAQGESPALYRGRHIAFERPGDPPAHYSFELASTHFAALHAPRASAVDGALIEWLDRDLADAAERGFRRKVVYLHGDLYSSHPAASAVAPELRAALEAVLAARGVSLVLSGETPGLELSHPLRTDGAHPAAGARIGSGEGVVYLRTGSGGREEHRSWSPDPAPAWLRLREAQRKAFALLEDVGGSHLRVRVMAVPDGGGEPVELDSFELD